jgi:hypothetical protein
MKITLKTLFESSPSLATLAAIRGPAKFCFRVAKAMKIFRTELDTLETQRKALIEKHGGTLDQKLSIFKYESEEEQAAMAEEFTELLKEEIEVAVDPIAVPVDLNGLSANDMAQLDWLLKE